MVILKQVVCARCSHAWFPRININEIKMCPRCKSYYWNNPYHPKVRTTKTLIDGFRNNTK